MAFPPPDSQAGRRRRCSSDPQTHAGGRPGGTSPRQPAALCRGHAKDAALVFRLRTAQMSECRCSRCLTGVLDRATWGRATRRGVWLPTEGARARLPVNGLGGGGQTDRRGGEQERSCASSAGGGCRPPWVQNRRVSGRRVGAEDCRGLTHLLRGFLRPQRPQQPTGRPGGGGCRPRALPGTRWKLANLERDAPLHAAPRPHHCAPSTPRCFMRTMCFSPS